MFVYLVRHAQSEGNARRIFQGQAEYPLSELGRKQAAALGKWLAGQNTKFDAVYASPLSRAADTAAIVAEATGSPAPVHEPDIIEYHSGRVQGLSINEIDEQYPELKTRPLDERGCMAQWGGESIEDVRERVLRFRQRLLDSHGDGEHIMAVMHGGSLYQTLNTWCGWPAPRNYFMDTGNCCCFRLNLREVSGEKVAVMQWMLPLGLIDPALEPIPA